MRILDQLLVTGAILLSTAGFAQEKHKGEKDPAAMAETRTARMTEELSLTADQVEKVKAINLKHAEKLIAIRDQDVDKDEKQKAMAQLREWRQGELKHVLTAEQITRLQELRKERKLQKDKLKGSDDPDAE